MEAILNEMEPVVRSIGNKMWTRIRAIRERFDKREVYQIGRAAMIEAIPRFDPSLGDTRKNFLACRIRGAILDEARTAGLVRVPKTAFKNKEEIKKTFCCSSKDDDEFNIEDVPCNETRYTERDDRIDSFLDSLTSDSRSLIVRYFGLYGQQCEPLNVICKDLGISACRASVRLHNILEYARGCSMLVGA